MKKPVKQVQKKNKKFVPNVHTSYLRKVYYISEYVKMVPTAIKTIKAWRKKHPFDAIAFTGTSGAALAYPLALALKVPLICVRKKGDGNHFKSSIEGVTNSNKYLIVDDFIVSGETMDRIIQTIRGTGSMAKPVGIYLYADRSTRLNFYGTYNTVPIVR